MEHFDYVIVGGGTSASVLAYRLGEAGKRVCVLEAGPPDRSPFIRLPAGFMKAMFDPKIAYQYHHEPTDAVAGRKIHVAQGRTLGGSSAVNGMVYNRGAPLGFDGWAQMGNPGWSYRDVLPYFKRSERAIGMGEDEYRGRDGRWPIEESRWKDAVCDTFIEAAESLGVPRNPDMNGETQAGTGYYQTFVHNGRRWSAAHSFLHPARKKFGVDVRTNSPVVRLLFEGKKITGVRYRRGGGDSMEEVYANEAVIVSAGTANTAKLLQLSGIGPSEVLRDFGIAIRHELGGVGGNFRDHLSPRLTGRSKLGVDSINNRARGLLAVREAANWALNKRSILGIPSMQAYVYWMSDPSMDTPDFSLSFSPASFKAGLIGKLDSYPGMTLGAKQLRPESNGYVRIRSADDRDPPILQPNYLSSEYDRMVVVNALKFTRSLMESGPMSRILEAETLPGPSVNTDDEWLDFARRSGNSGYHLMGTAKMGPASDPAAVVDHRLKVHGLEGLYVADCSIMPTMPSGNTCSTAMMIGEKCSDMLLGKDIDGSEQPHQAANTLH